MNPTSTGAKSSFNKSVTQKVLCRQKKGGSCCLVLFKQKNGIATGEKTNILSEDTLGKIKLLDDLCYLYLDFCFDLLYLYLYLYFPIQITEKYSIELC